jgi:hypothetical protein
VKGASTVEVMPEIPDKPLDDIDSKKNVKYLKKAIKSQSKDPHTTK